MPVYTRSEFRNRVNARLSNKIGVAADINGSLDAVARMVANEIDLRSTKRKASTPARLFDDVYSYSCPSDLKGTGIVGFQRQTEKRGTLEDWSLTTEEDFDRYKTSVSGLVAISDRDMVRKLRVSLDADEENATVTTFDSTTAGLASSSWAAVGDAETLTTDTDNYVDGSGSLKWNIGTAGGTTAGVTASTVNTFDLTNYISAGSAFAWVYIVSTTDLTNWILRLGSDSSNYYSMTATTTNENASFVAGWNLIRWDFSGKTTTGTPDDDACDYISLHMTKTAGKVSEEGYRVDGLTIHTGEIWNTIYYSKYPWQSAAGTWKENSTLDTDYLNVDTDEFDLFVEKAVSVIGYDIKENETADRARQSYQDMADRYRMRYPSEALLLTTTYMNFA